MLAFPFAFAIYWGEQLVLLYNDEYLPLLDAKHPAALGKTAEEVWAEAWEAVHQPMMAAFSEGRSLKEYEALIPIMIDGSLQDRWFTYSSHPIHDGGRIVGVGNSVQDITNAVIARKAVRDSEARLSQVLSATTDAVVVVNREWNFSYLNAPAIATYAAGRDLLGKNLWKEFPDAVYEGSPYVEHYERDVRGRSRLI